MSPEQKLADVSDDLLTATCSLAEWETQGGYAIEQLGHVGNSPDDLFDAVQGVGRIADGSSEIEKGDLEGLSGFASVIVSLVLCLGRALGHVGVDKWENILEPLPGLLRVRVMDLGGRARLGELK